MRNVLEDKDMQYMAIYYGKRFDQSAAARISSFGGVKEMEQNFNTLIKTKDGIIAGTNNGEVFVYDGCIMPNAFGSPTTRNIDAWVRKIVETPKGIYVSRKRARFF